MKTYLIFLICCFLMVLPGLVNAQAPGCEDDDCGSNYGQVLGNFFGTIAYSNGSCTGTGNGCRQCVEFVERYYSHPEWTGNAEVWFTETEADERDMLRRNDGGNTVPVPASSIFINLKQY